jgi:hypothetical protein
VAREPLAERSAGGVPVNQEAGSPDRPCEGASSSELKRALEVVAKSLELALALKAGLHRLREGGRPPVAPDRPAFDPESWRVLVAYLVEERRLIEFLVGPGHSYPDNICVDCFRSPDGETWPFPDNEVRTQLRGRAKRINKRLTHFSWTMTKRDSRLDAGDWDTRYLDRLVDSLSLFAEWLDTTGRSPLAETLRGSMSSIPHVVPDL